MYVIGIIPARLESTRLPGKPLMKIAGKPMLQHVWEQASRSKLNKVIIATDSKEIYNVATRFGAHVEMTSALHESGTGRVVELSERYQADFYINIQGDEPLIAPELIDELIRQFSLHQDIDVFSAINPSCTKEEFYSPHTVKVVLDNNGDALYFSRAPIPYMGEKSSLETYRMKHIGIYGYTSRALEVYKESEPGHLEKLEKLEQLRFLENGIKIKMIHTDYESFGVDTIEDLMKIREIMEERK